MCCQPIACQAEEEPKPQQFLYRQSWHVPQTAFHPPHPSRDASETLMGSRQCLTPPHKLLEELWAASGHKGALQLITDI